MLWICCAIGRVIQSSVLCQHATGTKFRPADSKVKLLSIRSVTRGVAGGAKPPLKVFSLPCINVLDIVLKKTIRKLFTLPSVLSWLRTCSLFQQTSSKNVYIHSLCWFVNYLVTEFWRVIGSVLSFCHLISNCYWQVTWHLLVYWQKQFLISMPNREYLIPCFYLLYRIASLKKICPKWTAPPVTVWRKWRGSSFKHFAENNQPGPQPTDIFGGGKTM